MGFERTVGHCWRSSPAITRRFAAQRNAAPMHGETKSVQKSSETVEMRQGSTTVEFSHRGQASQMARGDGVGISTSRLLCGGTGLVALCPASARLPYQWVAVTLLVVRGDSLGADDLGGRCIANAVLAGSVCAVRCACGGMARGACNGWIGASGQGAGAVLSPPPAWCWSLTHG